MYIFLLSIFYKFYYSFALKVTKKNEGVEYLARIEIVLSSKIF